MTIWEQIYQRYQKNGEEYATLSPGLIPDFLEFISKYEFPKKRVLDIACGNGKYLLFLQSLGFEVEGIDSSATAVAMTKAAIGEDKKVEVADMFEYDYPEDRYDLVISVAAIHHGLKQQVRRAVAGIYTSLIDGGRFFVTLPDNEGQKHWVTMFEHEEIEPGTRVPLGGPEKGLPHSSYTRKEIEEMFSKFRKVELKLLAEKGRWIVSGIK